MQARIAQRMPSRHQKTFVRSTVSLIALTAIISLGLPNAAHAATVRVEAEKMTLGSYGIETGSFASNRAWIRLRAPSGTAKTKFTGASGTHNVAVTYFDESDGVASFTLKVNGAVVGTKRMDAATNDPWATAKTLRTHTFSGVTIGNGATIEIVGVENKGEPARIDVIEITSVAAPAPTPTPTPEPTPTPTPTPEPTPTPTPSGYVRPYGDLAPWNVPVVGLPKSTNSGTLASSLWNNAPSSKAGNFNLNFDDYTYPVYDARQATGLYTVRVTTGWASNINGQKIPFNPAWKPAPGSDAQIIIIDPATGREWNLWQVSFNGTTVNISNGNLVTGDYRTKTDGFKPSRGAGIQYLAMLVRPEEIAQGVIRHALSMPIRNTDGDTFVAPATKLEHPNNPPGIPEGTRFALNVTDAQIETWAKSLPSTLPEQTRQSARIIARALRDYGWFITDTSGGASLQFEARVSAGSKWDALGLGKRSINGKEYPRDLLDGLLTRDRILAIVPSDKYPADKRP